MATLEVTVDGVRYEFTDEVPAEARRFYDAVHHDPQLKRQAEALYHPDEIAALAQSHGFATTPDEILHYIVAVNEARGKHTDELTDEELDMVSGGAPPSGYCSYPLPTCCNTSYYGCGPICFCYQGPGM